MIYYKKKSVSKERYVNMVLTAREYNILDYFCKHPEEYITSKKLATILSVSDRTIKSDLASVKDYCNSLSFISLQSKKGKGTKLTIEDRVEFNSFFHKRILSKKETIDKENSSRVKKIILYLLSHNKPVIKYKLQEIFFISDSTLYQDMKQAKKLVEKYNLTVHYKKEQGYEIEGSEANKRKCILNEHLFRLSEDLNRNSTLHIEYTTELTETVTHILDKYEFSISDFLLQNLLMHISLTLHRIDKKHFIRELNEVMDVKDSIEYKISEEIISYYINESTFRDYNLKYEIYYLATNLMSKNDLNNNIIISEEIYSFIDDSLEKIKLKFGVDFTTESDFKNSIALHVAPLLTRIKLDMQLKSKLSTEIKQSFPVATNIASYLSQLIFDKFHLKVNDDEVSYLSSYFNYGLQRYSVIEKQKNILLISSLRRSETMLLKDKILTWFKNQVSDVTIVDPRKLNMDISKFDAILTTEEHVSRYKGSAVKVNVFPDDQDFLKINLAINGFDSIHSIVSKFNKDLTFIGKVGSKEEMIDTLCGMAEKKYKLNSELKESIYAREERGDTYFGDLIAMPHPLTPTTDQTFVALGLLDQPIEWANNEYVKLVILVSIEKNNPKSFQLWHYLSSLVTNENMIEDLYDNLTYEHFIEKLEESLRDMF